jgi:predicted nucleotidyltransferase
MNTPSLAELQTLASQLPEKIPYLKLLILFGSRARGDFNDHSDWDFAAFYDKNIRQTHINENVWNAFEVPSLISQTFNIPDDKIGVVELNRGSDLISHFVARDGKLLYEQEAGEFERFQNQALLQSAELSRMHQENLTRVHQFLARWKV